MESTHQTNLHKPFLNDSYLSELKNVKLISIENDLKDDNYVELIFDRTIFHPQGGGQPSDEGYIELLESNEYALEGGPKIQIESLSYDREKDQISHKIKKINLGNCQIGDVFNMKINEEKRKLYARIHSGGHLLDIAITKLNLNLIPGKGYHFPDGPYVEYSGKIEKNDIVPLQEKIEKISNEIIQETAEENKSIVKIYSYDEGVKEFKSIPSYLPVDKPFRWVKLTLIVLTLPAKISKKCE